MQPGSVAVVVIYENRWVLGLADAWRRDGARLIAEGGLSADDIIAALDADRALLTRRHSWTAAERRSHR